ncbi:MAG: helix-turn-helix transcriptional regulator [Elusimicrobia bacterium]|nr:helix-turn-helix transcriptional regulator [Elusimicrobiota bacterium]
MKRKKNIHEGSSVRDWFAEEEAKDPNFRASVEKAMARRRVAQQIYDARTKAGVSQPELARRLGTSQAAISRMEAGAQNMTIDIIESVARALGGRFESQIILSRRA